jgi:hypothetical protein
MLSVLRFNFSAERAKSARYAGTLTPTWGDVTRLEDCAWSLGFGLGGTGPAFSGECQYRLLADRLAGYLWLFTAPHGYAVGGVTVRVD